LPKSEQKKKDKLTSARLLPNRPLDPEKDDVEVRPKGQVFAEAAAQVGPDNIEPPAQKELLAPPEAAERPQVVQNGRILATYVGMHLHRDKGDAALVHLDFSFPLDETHNGHLPKKVKNAWDYLASSGDVAVRVGDMPAMTLDVYLDPKEKKPELHLIGADFSRAIVQVVEETGKGASKKVTRFAFRLLTERTNVLMQWAGWSDGKLFWLTLKPTQKSLDD
jgi:hypothetical protein